MWQYKQKDCKCESNACRSKDQRLDPTTLWRGFNIKAGADTGQKRAGNLGVRGDVKAGVDGGEKGPFLFECRAAISATGEVRAQIATWLGAAGCCFDQRVFITFAWHRNFSASCLRA